MALHNHLLLNGYTNSPPTDEEWVVNWMQDLVEQIGMNTIKGPFASYVTKEGNKGLTCIVMIETSHIALHIWDETEPAFIQFDLYTCSTLPSRQVLKNLEDNLGIFDYTHMVLNRGEGFKINYSDSQIQMLY
jgi:S-adenosylmethionine/arginine decarboxylase-like enzyme